MRVDANSSRVNLSRPRKGTTPCVVFRLLERKVPEIEATRERGQSGMKGIASVAAVARCAAVIVGATTIQEVIDAIVDQVMELGASSAAVHLTADDDERSLRLAAHRNVSPALFSSHSPHLASRAAETKELQAIYDFDRIDRTLVSARKLLEDTKSRSMFSAPLLAFGRLQGVLTWTLPKSHRPSARDRAALASMAEVFAIGIAKARSSVPATDPTPYGQLVAEVARRHGLEAIVHERETRLRAIFDHTFEFIGLLSTDGVLLEANQTALDFVGATREQVVGRKFAEGPWWSEAQSARDMLENAIERAALGEVVRFEATHPGRDGRQIVVDFTLSPVRDESGEVVFLVPDGHDITERKEWERQREEWISIIAHDLRQPISAIQLWTRLLSAEGRDDRDEAIAHIRTSIKHLARMTSDLLDASRVEAGRMTLHRLETDLEKLVHDTVARQGIEGREIRIDVCGPIPRLHLDAERIEQVLGNLLSNAIKYGRPETVVEIRLVFDGDAVLSITNRGDGIDPSEMPLLFRRFHRTAKARAGARAGVGLGLYIAAGLVEAHGGRLWAESEQGATTTFHVRLPKGEST